MSSDSGKGNLQDGEESLIFIAFANDLSEEEKNNEDKEKRKLQSKIRSKRYREKKKINAIVNSHISNPLTVTVEEKERIEHRKEKGRQKSQRYRDKQRIIHLMNLQTQDFDINESSENSMDCDEISIHSIQSTSSSEPTITIQSVTSVAESTVEVATDTPTPFVKVQKAIKSTCQVIKPIPEPDEFQKLSLSAPDSPVHDSVPFTRSKNNQFQKKNSMDNFIGDFDPELSNREQRKLNRKLHSDGTNKKPAALYDENGILIHVGKDLCDCLEEECPGCFFPCPKCRSYKCGYECRVNRKTQVEQIECDVSQAVVKNPYFLVKPTGGG